MKDADCPPAVKAAAAHVAGTSWPKPFVTTSCRRYRWLPLSVLSEGARHALAAVASDHQCFASRRLLLIQVLHLLPHVSHRPDPQVSYDTLLDNFFLKAVANALLRSMSDHGRIFPGGEEGLT